MTMDKETDTASRARARALTSQMDQADGADGAAQANPLASLQQPEPQVFDIHIAADGNWYHEGGLIGRKPLVKLFASVLRREADGSFWLVTPVERGRITVEDAPFVITAMQVTGTGTAQIIEFTSNVDDDVTLSPAHTLTMRGHGAGDDLRPYIEMRDGLEACLSRPVFYELAGLAVDASDDDDTLGVWSNGTFFPLVGG